MEHTKPAGRVAIITGASRGIGAATALALARRGIASVLAVRNPESAGAVADAVRKAGVPCRIEACDVADYATVQRTVQQTLDCWGRLDIVINNAGQIEPQGPLADTNPAEWVQAINVNLAGAYHLIRAALPSLLASQGAIVNVSTGAAHTPRDGWSAYCSSKAGLYMLTRCMVNEYANKGVSTFSLQPGLVDTGMQGRIRDVGANEISRVPQAQLDPPERSADVIAWLCDRMPKDLLGADLSINDVDLFNRAAGASKSATSAG